MASMRFNTLMATTLVLVAGLGYLLYSARAQVAAPQLAQAPLNTSRTIEPALILAVDDSTSMDFETLFPSSDGVAWWHSTNDSFTGLDRNNGSDSGALNFNRDGASGDVWKKYAYLFPFGYGSGNDGRGRGDSTNEHFAIPPVPAYGWARSPDVNKAYFNPEEVYSPWIEADGSFLEGVDGIDAATGQVSPGNAPADPSRGRTRLNLTRDFIYAGDGAGFVFSAGMIVPKGTRYKDVSCTEGASVENTGNDNQLDRWGFKLAREDRRVLGGAAGARCSLAIGYYPAVFYVLATRSQALADAIGYDADPLDDGALAPSGAALRRFEIRPGNFVDGAYAATINNFANWFSYYRKRHLAARAGLSLAFADQNLKIRAGYFQINNRQDVAMRRLDVAAERRQLYDNMFALGSAGTTPNKEAVMHLGEQFKRSYVKDVSPVQLSCQKNVGMLISDGFSDNSTPYFGNADNEDAAVFPAPLKDATANTMADIAAHYYRTPLAPPGLPDDGAVGVDVGCSAATPDPRLDCQSAPHMNFYGVTLGAQGLVHGNPGAGNQTRDPFAYHPSWPTAFYDRHPSAVDDMWHATLNARGDFINASTPGALVGAIQRVVTAVAAGASASGSIAITGARVGAGSLAVEPFYEATSSTDWYGKLAASTASTDAVTGAVTYTRVWEAAEQLPAAGDRNIHFGVASDASETKSRQFTAGQLFATGIRSLAGLCSDALAPAGCTAANLEGLRVTLAQAVAYLRGDASLEGRGLRARSGILGDIVNSSPVISSSRDDYGYTGWGGSIATSYAGYLEAKKAAGHSMVYVGANDGMLHAFDGRDGKEMFAYIPATALGHLGNLLLPPDPDPKAVQRFQHRYYVDGPITVSDVLIGNSWKTVMIGTSGAGGRSVFALDVTDPQRISVMWEINDLVTGDGSMNSRIGYVLGKPVVVPVNTVNGVAWKAIFGNGYNSASQLASLFVVDIGTGAAQVISASENDEGSDVAGHNGLGNVVVLDRQHVEGDSVRSGRDGYADTVYAGDQNGAVWKFDLVAGSVAFEGEPLFVARDANGRRQPINGGLEATLGFGGAVSVYFGTGSFSFEGDNVDNSPQTLYAVADRGQPVAGRGTLLVQLIEEGGVGDYRVTSSNAIGASHNGWYVDLPAGERFVGNPRLDNGIVFFATYAPSSADASACSAGGSNWLYGLDAISGAASLARVRVGSPTGTPPGATTGAIALNTSGDAPVTDVALLSTAAAAPLSGSDEQGDVAGVGCSTIVQVPGSKPLYLPRACGRQSWRQLR